MRKKCYPLFLLVLSGLMFPGAVPQMDSRDFKLNTHDGKTFEFSEIKGKQGVVFVFFASWCASCNSIIPQIKDLAALAEGQNVSVYGISLQEDSKSIKKFIKKKSIRYPILMDTTMETATKYGVRAIPTIIGFNKAGKIIFRENELPSDLSSLIDRLSKDS